MRGSRCHEIEYPDMAAGLVFDIECNYREFFEFRGLNFRFCLSSQLDGYLLLATGSSRWLSFATFQLNSFTQNLIEHS